MPENRVLKKKKDGQKKPEKELKEKFKGAYVEASGFQSKLVSQLSLHRATSILWQDSMTKESKKYPY